MENEEILKVNAFFESREWRFGDNHTLVDELDLGGAFVLNIASKSNLSCWQRGAGKKGILITKEKGENGQIAEKVQTYPFL